MSIKSKKPIGLSLSEQPAGASSNKPFFNISVDTIVSQNYSLIIDANGLKNAKVKISYDELTYVKELGHGSFGVVSLVQDKYGKQYALKDIKITQDDNAQKNIYRELHSYLDYNHTHIVSTFNVYFLTGMRVCILYEYCLYGSASDLKKRLKSGKYNENGIGVLAIDTLRALVYVHDKNIIHRDIKPDNILIDEEGNCKLADFGVATSILVHDEKQAQYTFAGSISYMAPERIQSDKYTVSSDVWSLGITFVELLRGQFPYGELNSIFNALSVIVKGPAPLLTKEMGYSGYCCEFVNAMLEKDPTKRRSAKELLDLTFCKMYLKKEKEVREQFAKWIRREFQEKQ